MFKEKTLFVVGAGASHEVGLPIGSELKSHIVRALTVNVEMGTIVSCDRHIVESIQQHVRLSGGRDINPHLRAARHICSALDQASSIDNFLHSHEDNAELVFCGKLAIARAILLAESHSQLAFEDWRGGSVLPDVNGTWFSEFFRLLVDRVTKRDVHNLFKNVSFIVFNYDRCIEHFLIHSVAKYYGLPQAEAAEIVNQLIILHPYGTVGRLEWQPGSAISVAYGSGDQLPLSVHSQIKTFSERIEQEATLDSIRSEVANASRVVFLGFSYHPQNMEILQPKQKTHAHKIFGTAYQVSNSDTEVIREQLHTMFDSEGHKADVRIDNKLKCADLFSEYWRSLSL